MSIVPLLAFTCFVGAVAAGMRRVAAQRRLRVVVARAAAAVAMPAVAPSAAVPRPSRAPLVQRLSRLTLLLRPGASREELALRLAGAGVARRMTPEVFLGLQGALLVGSVLLGMSTFAAGSHVDGLLLALGGTGCALVVPDRLLASRAARRREAILAELPGALDLLAVTVEAGLGFDAAVARVAQATSGPLTEEFNTMLAELRYGEARTNALQRFASRIGSEEVAQFARVVIRADQLGTSLGTSLRMQAVDARARRQLAAEEKANKAPVKMLFPTIIFIFPALFVVVLGPSVLSLGAFLK
jgi:tight adherence protein C